VCELSSFQLEDVRTLACEVAVLLNLEPDHLDRHGSFEAYRDAKLRIFERARAKVVPRGLGLPGIEFAADDPLPAEPLIRGAHNRENAAAATAARARPAWGTTRSPTRCERSRASAPPGAGRRGRRRALRERLEGDERRRCAPRARRVCGRAGAPDPRRLAQGRGLRPAGGGGRSERPLDPPRRRGGGELAAAFGDAAHDDETLERAVLHAQAQSEPGDVVLLSPACASYDQYANFEERGDHFRRLVAELGG
jgi:UDP-N-acetylmuramoylalanine--D-glutamate ligase